MGVPRNRTTQVLHKVLCPRRIEMDSKKKTVQHCTCAAAVISVCILGHTLPCGTVALVHARAHCATHNSDISPFVLLGHKSE